MLFSRDRQEREKRRYREKVQRTIAVIQLRFGIVVNQSVIIPRGFEMKYPSCNSTKWEFLKKVRFSTGVWDMNQKLLVLVPVSAQPNLNLLIIL